MINSNQCVLILCKHYFVGEYRWFWLGEIGENEQDNGLNISNPNFRDWNVIIQKLCRTSNWRYENAKGELDKRRRTMIEKEWRKVKQKESSGTKLHIWTLELIGRP